MVKWVHKRALPIPALTLTDPALSVAYRYWSDQKVGTTLPPRCAVDTPIFRLVVPDALWLQAKSYTGHLAPFLAAPHVEDDTQTLAEAQRLDLECVFVTGVPALQLIELAVQDRSLVYQRLLLPTADDGDTVTELVEVCKLGTLRLVRPGTAAV